MFHILFYKNLILASIFEGKNKIKKDKNEFFEELELRYEDCNLQSPPKEALFDDYKYPENQEILPLIKHAFSNIRIEINNLGLESIQPFNHTDIDYEENFIMSFSGEFIREHYPKNEIFCDLLNEI